MKIVPLNPLKSIVDRFRGTGEYSVSIPVFDGALKPNNVLESATVLFEHPGLEDLAISADGQLFAACANDVVEIGSTGEVRCVTQFRSPVQALTVFAEGLVAATPDGLFFVGGGYDGKQVDSVAGRPLSCVNALHERADGTLVISEGSERTPYQEWSRDLLEHGRGGRVVGFSPHSDESTVLADGLAYPYGVCADDGRLLVAESWAHQVLAVEGGERSAVVSELPCYPSRISKAVGSGFWLTCFAPRSQLLEFVLRESRYRAEMMRTIEPRHWIAPALSSGSDMLEPMQQGGLRVMGILKPWAPPRSYGLVIRLGDDMLPRYSLHSRVGGLHHGITAAVEHDGILFALSKGAGRILRIDLASINLDG